MPITSLNINFTGKNYVIGHKNPDTDSVTSAIAYSFLKEQTKTKEEDSFIPLAAGNLTPETQYILKYFGIQKPEVKTDLSLRVGDILQKRPLSKVSIQEKDSLRELYNIMYENNLDTMPVLNEQEEVIGLISPKDILKFNLDKQDTLKTLKHKNISFEKLKRLLDAQVLCGEKFLNDPIAGNVNMGVYSCDETRKIDLKDAMVLVGDREDIQEEVINQGAKALVITKGKQPSERIVNLAKEKDLIILTTRHGTSSSTKLIEQSVPVKYIMNSSFTSIDINDKVDDIQGKVKAAKQQIFPITSEGKFVGVLTLDEILKPTERDYILVDHNSPAQFAKGIKRENIKEIIDHHRQEFLPTTGRIPTTYGDVGASATLVAKSFKANSVEIPKEIAGMLWAAIISDTDCLLSPTTTNEDIKIANELRKIANIQNPGELMDKILEQRDAAIEALNPNELVNFDRKTYKTNDSEYKFSINQISTLKSSKYEEKIPSLIEELDKLEKENSLNGATIMITDTRKKMTILICSKNLQKQAQEIYRNTSEEFLETIIKGTQYSYDEVVGMIAKNGYANLQNVSSRKEQVEPFVRALFEN